MQDKDEDVCVKVNVVAELVAVAGALRVSADCVTPTTVVPAGIPVPVTVCPMETPV